jgi:hypothetical protein
METGLMYLVENGLLGMLNLPVMVEKSQRGEEEW